MPIKVLTITLAVVILLIILELIRREKLTFKYAFGWLIVSVLAIVLTVFDHILFGIAYFFGFQLPSNFIFFTLLTVFIFLSLLLTLFLCQQNNRNDKIAQTIAVLEFELKELKNKLTSKKNDDK